MPKALGTVAIQPQHNLVAQLQPRLFDETRGTAGILGRVAAAVLCQNGVVKTLHPKLHRHSAIALQQGKHFPIHRIGAGGTADARQLWVAAAGLHRRQKGGHIAPVNGRKAAAEKGDFGFLRVTAVG